MYVSRRGARLLWDVESGRSAQHNPAGYLARLSSPPARYDNILSRLLLPSVRPPAWVTWIPALPGIRGNDNRSRSPLMVLLREVPYRELNLG